MKSRAVLLAISSFALLSLSFSGPVISAAKVFTTDFQVLGPFEEYADDTNLVGLITPRESLVNIKERLSVAVSGYSYSKITTTAGHDVTKGRLYVLTFNLPLKTMLGPNGIDCKVEFLDTSYNSLQSFTFSLKPLKSNSVNPGDYLSSYYSIKDTIVDPDNYSSKIGEEMMFNGFIDYFNIDNYYRLNLDTIYLTHKCLKNDLEITAEAYLHFDDYDSIFKRMYPKNGTPEFDIPLTVTKTNNIVTFKFRDTMYVHPQTMEMSLDARPDFLATNYFYLPVNRRSDMFNQKFTLRVDSFGYNKTTFSWDIRYTNTRDLIGDCNNADYCVRGEM